MKLIIKGGWINYSVVCELVYLACGAQCDAVFTHHYFAGRGLEMGLCGVAWWEKGHAA